MPDPNKRPMPPASPEDVRSSDIDKSRGRGTEYDERANAFSSVYVKEAQSHDKVQIETRKSDMEGIIIFVRSLFVVVDHG